MEESDLLGSIRQMVDDEHRIRAEVERGETDADAARARLTDLQESLDQCWDLLRQRRAKLEFHEDPDQAELRPKEVVEKYWS
jgi:hypothetical protein